jgi:hypothetical protein
MPVKSLVLAVLLLSIPAAVAAQSYAIQGTEHYFRVDAELSPGGRGPVVSGYVYSTYGHTTGNVRLLVEGLDGAGQVTSSTIVWVFGTVPPNGRAYFETRVPAGATTVRTRVLSYEPVGRGQ